MKILIVDDEEMIRNVLKEYVEFEGGEAYEAADGMEAVKLCRENDYDLESSFPQALKSHRNRSVSS